MKLKTTKITKLDRLDNYGNTTFIIEFADGQKGFYTSKNPDQTKFVIGQETDCNIEQKEGSKGPYNKITMPPSDGFKPGGGRPMPEPRVQMISFAAAYTKDLIVGGKVSMNDLEKEFNRLYNLMISKL
jgi:hypothetical protein